MIKDFSRGFLNGVYGTRDEILESQYESIQRRGMNAGRTQRLGESVACLLLDLYSFHHIVVHPELDVRVKVGITTFALIDATSRILGSYHQEGPTLEGVIGRVRRLATKG
jgi:hypothetical protein